MKESGWGEGIIRLLVPENIHTHPMDGHWKFWGGGGGLNGQTFEQKEQSQTGISRGQGVQDKKTSVGEVWIFSKITK